MTEHQGGNSEQVLQSVRRIILEAGFGCDLDDRTGYLAVSPRLDDDREQIVYVKPTEIQMESGLVVVTVFSPCAVMTDAMLRDHRLLLRLLAENGRARFGRYSIIDTDSSTRLLVVMCDQLVETMEVEEVTAMIRHVAEMADGFERGIARDDY